MSGFHAIWVVFTDIVPYVLVLTSIVFVHEMGHFLVGRWCGVKVDAFSIGIGPELYGFDDKHGTHWRLAAYPIGGYVKFHGDANGASVPDNEGVAAMSRQERSVTLQGQPVWKRALVVVAGPAVNFIFAILLFSGMFYISGRNELPAIIANVAKASAAAVAGFQQGDKITAIGNVKINDFNDVQRIIMNNANVPLGVTVMRQGHALLLHVTPAAVVIKSSLGDQTIGRIGIQNDASPTAWRHISYSLPGALRAGSSETWYWVANTGTALKRIVTGHASASQISGPIRIGALAGKMARSSFDSLLSLMAILSVSIGLMNLLPIPMLDGGHLLFYAYEAVFRRPMSERVQEYGFRFGLATVAAMMIFAISNDILQMLHLV